MVKNSLERNEFGDSVHEHFGPGGASGKLVRTLEFMIYFVGILGTILSLPQAFRVWYLQDVSGISMTWWIVLTLFTPFWILYGFLHGKRSLVMTYVVWLVINLLVIAGLFFVG